MTRRRFAPMLLALVVALGLLPLSPASAAVNKPPRIKKAVMKDRNMDGKADRIVLTYTEKINHRADRDGRYPFKIQGYKIRKVTKAYRSPKLVILVRPGAKAKPRPDFIQYSRTRKQPVKDLKRKQARTQDFRANIIGLAPLPTPQHTLMVNKSGPGTITSVPAGISCAPTCQASFDKGTQVTLNAVPDEGASPGVTWSGCASYTDTTCTVTMDAGKSVGATFTAAGSQALTVSREGNGSVTSSSTPPQDTQISCTTSCATSTVSYPENSIVVLTAAPGQEGMLITWSGHCSGAGETCELLMDGPKTVGVKFEIPTLSVNPVGQGTLTSDPAGINCGPVGTACSAEFAEGSDVTLTARAEDGWELAGWSGDTSCADSNTTCVVTMDATKSVTATFELVGTGPVMHTLSVTKSEGTVACVASDGGTACNGDYEEGTTVTITATTAGLNVVPTWTGCDTAVLNVCTVTMNADKAVNVSWGTV